MYRISIARSFYFSILFIALIVSGCSDKKKVVNIQLNWKSTDPLLIPSIIREKEFQKGNLVINPSFETGRFFAIDTTKTTFSLNGWTRLGENVFWADVRDDALYHKDESADGFHAIKIIRKNADETDLQGEGVISDYIKVIPGNYQLKCDLRLENIESGIKRLSGNLIDAVNIRIFYYDKNKLLIRSSVYNPSGDNVIDNSFKGYSFSGFDYIRKLDWSRINCISNHFPFEEGDIPSDARFVKIFFGLKGTGTMWVDMVDFRYSTANFSLLEKCEAFFTKDYEPVEMLVPSPVSALNYRKTDLVRGTEEKPLYPIILVPRNFRGNDLVVIEPLRNALESIIPVKNKKRVSEIAVVNRLENYVIESGRLIFSIGNTSIFNDNAETLPVQEIKDKSQSYIINSQESIENLVYVFSNSPEGYYYAVNTIVKLIETENKVYHHYDIVDYPEFENRGFIARTEDEKTYLPEKELIKLLSIGLNNIFIAPSSETNSFSKAAGYYANHKQYLSRFYKSHPCFNYGLCAIDLEYSGQGQNEINDLAAIKRVEDAARATAEIVNKFTSGEEGSILLSDRGLWESQELVSPNVAVKMLDMDDYNQFVGLNHLFFDSFVKNLKNKEQNADNLYFLPVFSYNTIIDKSGIYGRYYFKDLYFNENEPDVLLWQGPAEYSFLIDGAEMLRFTAESGKKAVWFDNTLMINKKYRVEKSNASKYPGKARLGSFFEAFNVSFNISPSDFHKKESIINLPDFSPVSLIRLSTAADFLWAPQKYDPEFALWKVLVKRFGKENAIRLIRFNDLCYSLLYIAMTGEEGGISQKNFRDGEEIIRIMADEWEKISKDLGKDILFLNQLTDKKNQVITRFYQVKTKRGGDR